jgi:hypothetical protein
VSATAVGKPIAGGDAAPRGAAISVRSSSEGSPRERAWLKGHQGVHRGRNASRHMVSARAQRDPGRQSPGVVDLDGWVALGAENLGRVLAPVSPVPRSSGNTLKWDPSLRKVTWFGQNQVPPVRTPRGGGSQPRGGRCQTHEALGRGDVFARQANHMRGARGVAMRRASSIYPETL